jgi:hypothetical protein
VALRADWPNNFFHGQAKARLYIDAGDAAQREQLDAIFRGQSGGPTEALFSAVISEWLPTEEAEIEVDWGESPTMKVGSVGNVTMQRLKDDTGKPTSLQGAAAMAGFQLETMDLASSAGSEWSDPDLRPLEGDSGTLHEFSWSS